MRNAVMTKKPKGTKPNEVQRSVEPHANLSINELMNHILPNTTEELQDVIRRLEDMADNINTYDIASHIDVDASEINLRDLADHITDNIEINASDIDIDYRDLGSRIASEIYSNDRLDTLERKMDLILKHLGITPENA